MIGAYVAMIDTDELHFAIIAVADQALQSQSLVDEIVAEGVVRLGRSIVLLGVDGHQVYGPPRIAEFLYYIAPHTLPWQRAEWSDKGPVEADDDDRDECPSDSTPDCRFENVRSGRTGGFKVVGAMA